MAVQNDYDRAARYLAKMEPETFCSWCFRLTRESFRFVRWLDTRTIPFPGSADRICDTVAHLERTDPPGQPWAIPLEFQVEPDALMFGRFLEYLGRLWVSEKPFTERGDRYWLAAAVVNLTGVGKARRVFDWSECGLLTALSPSERNLSEEPAELTLAKIDAGTVGRVILPLVPLMAGGCGSAIIERWVRIAESEPDVRKRSDFGTLARIFSKLSQGPDAWQSVLKEWNVIRSPVADEFRAEGELRGELRGKVAALIAFLEARFQSIPKDLVQRIGELDNVATLTRMLPLAATSASLSDFRKDAGL